MQDLGFREVVVIGGGIAGSSAALALAHAGRPATLIERDRAPMRRASLRNEGKIHLGLIYAAEDGRATALTQLDGALSFRRLLSRWTGGRADRLQVGKPFVYLVERDSLKTPEELAAHYDALSEACAARLAADPEADYLGRRPGRLAWPMAPGALARHFDPDRFLAGFETEELAVDTDGLADVVRTGLEESGTELLCGRTLRAATRLADGFALEGEGPDGPWRLRAGQVVNASSENLYALDAQAGLTPPAGWLHRLKYRVRVRLPEAMEAEAPSATLVLGAYGDVVILPGGLSYLSWYPRNMQGWTGALSPPETWETAMSGESDPEMLAEMARDTIARVAEWMPGVAAARGAVVDAGAILAHGRTDVDDPESGLHSRTISGVASLDGWHSLNPGKLTTGPMHGETAARAVLLEAGRAAA